MEYRNKENISYLPTPEPSSDVHDAHAYAYADANAKIPPPTRKPALKKAYIQTPLNEAMETRKQYGGYNALNGLNSLAELAGLATPPPSSPAIGGVDASALPSSPPSLPDFRGSESQKSRDDLEDENKDEFSESDSEAVAEAQESYDLTPRKKRTLTSESPKSCDIFASPSRTLVLGRGKQDWGSKKCTISPRIARVRHYVFPSTYTHISRTHLSVEPVSRMEAFMVRVYGRNGARINGITFAHGSRLRITKMRDSDGLAVSTLIPHKMAKKPRYKLTLTTHDPTLRITLGKTRLALHWTDLVHRKSVLSDCESDESESEAQDCPPSPSKRKRVGVEVKKEEQIENVQNTSDTTNNNTPQINPDHLGLIAQTLALNVPTSLTPVKEIVDSLLANNPSLDKERSKGDWEETVQLTLIHAPNDMFGCVQRTGRDVHNQPLPNLYYYQPANDPDRVRAQSLGPLTRVPRLASRASQAKSVFWKPVSVRPKKKW
ncbi:hypothetical protein E3P99_02567 [Wallemia hederae]|uniref:FHA domain-containing protein n=1 Tax=Wallemia hederae TaxID=1540922 RepID=A0A4T0FKC1_9BASI|nr:hypothetical protein E3P99_02567 [Wallemia hederae]